ncbi:hypothetical protein [Tenacibaculum sp. nBUS_03]|uniref:hypothetical protein n=1 Tax=Tenacibaculum sp. nBUS_03 TaxID=3395320 RepID=UPI003EB83F3F
MSTETQELPKVESINNQSLLAEQYVKVDQIWKTAISNIQLTGAKSLKCHVERPDSGSSTGGYLMLYLNEITPNVEPIIRQFHSGKGDFNAEVASDAIDFTKNNYVLAYAPHYSDNVKIVVSSAKIFFGSPIDLRLSACTHISHEIKSVTSFYKFDSNPLGFGYYNSWMIIREGSTFGEGRQVGIAQLDHNDPAQGIKVVSTIEFLKRGQTYNVSTTIYSTVRPVAGYTFTITK